MRIRPILILSAALGVLPAAHAMQRCVDAQGHVSFSDRPCPSNTQSSAYEPKPAAAPTSVTCGNWCCRCRP